MRIASPLIGLMVAVSPSFAHVATSVAAPPQQQPDSAQTLFNYGRDLIDESRYQDAEKQFREVLRRYPKSDQADKSSFYLITTLMKLGRSRDALTEITNFEKNYPNSSWMRDVQEKRISLTNQVPEALTRVLAVSTIARPLTPAQPAPGAVSSPQSAQDQNRQAEAQARQSAERARQDAERARQNAERNRQTLASAIFRRDAASTDPETSLQQEILRVLLLNNPERGLDVASDRLKADPSDPVVLANLSNIATSNSSRALPMLTSIAKTSSSMKARRDATFWLARSKTDKDSLTGTLLEILSGANDPETESAVASALAELNTPRAMAALKDIVRDKNRGLAARRTALNSIGRANTPDQLATLEDLYKSAADNVELRRLIVPLIGRISDARIVAVLGNIAKTDSDLTIRRNAVQWLSNRKEPEAIKALEDLLKE